jgi:hypothetical protein
MEYSFDCNYGWPHANLNIFISTSKTKLGEERKEKSKYPALVLSQATNKRENSSTSPFTVRPKLLTDTW